MIRYRCVYYKNMFVTVVRPAMLFGLETVKAELLVAELKVSSFSLGVMRMESIRKKNIGGTQRRGQSEQIKVLWTCSEEIL